MVPQQNKRYNNGSGQRRDNSQSSGYSAPYSGNAGWLYYRGYYHNLAQLKDDSQGQQRVMDRLNASLCSIQLSKVATVENWQNPMTFCLTTAHPGLLTGTGISHAANIKGEYKLGFNFDHTSGMPVIYGSSIKGALRSAFPEIDPRKRETIMAQSKRTYIFNLLNKISEEKFQEGDIDAICQLIFEGQKGGILQPMYERDVFFDAYPVASQNPSQQLFGSDYITPHDDVLKDPVPILFMKVLPGVTFKFQFRLFDLEVNKKTLKAATRCDLYKRIILDFGLGAKTNVGYGQFKK